MGFLERLGLTRSAYDEPPAAGWSDVDLTLLDSHVCDLSVEDLWRQQPHLRTVTSFIGRMVATVSLHVYERAEDGGRERVRDSYLSTLVNRPNETQVMFDFINASVIDLCLFDEFVWLISDDVNRADRWRLYRIPPRWIVDTRWSDPWTLEKLAIAEKGTGRKIWIDGEQIIRGHGYSPSSVARGKTPVDSLRDVLREQMEAAAYRGQLWKNGPRLGGVITRPQGANWDAASRRRFKASWQSQYSGRGSGSGGVPVLEDGMKFESFHLSAQDEQLVEMTKLSLSTVAQVYHINPTMVGVLDNANYSNVREFRKSLYGDSLGPVIKMIEELLNHVLIPRLAQSDKTIDPARHYIEFNVEERLRSSFEEKADVTSKAVGAPWMTVNEARAMNNLPAIDGGDALARPLNTDFGEASAGSDEGEAVV